MSEFKRILITGSSGFVGGWLAPMIADAFGSAQRFALRSAAPATEDPAWTILQADICDAAAVDAAIERARPDLVVHLAAQASIKQMLGASEMTWRTNFIGAYNLAASLARRNLAPVFFFSSSALVYGAGLRNGTVDESVTPQPLDPYSHSKFAAELALADILPPASRLLIARPVNHSGPGQRSRNFVLSSFAAQIAAIEAGQTEPRLVVGDLNRLRDFLDVRDVTNAYLALIRRGATLEPGAHVFNVASGQPQTIAAMLETLRRASRRDFEICVDPVLLRPSALDIASIACDASALRDATGWRPKHSVDDMLMSLLEDWRRLIRSGEMSAP